MSHWDLTEALGGEDRNGDRGEEDGEDGNGSGNPCALSPHCARYYAKDFLCMTPEASQQPQEVETFSLCLGKLKLREAESDAHGNTAGKSRAGF